MFAWKLFNTQLSIILASDEEQLIGTKNNQSNDILLESQTYHSTKCI